MIVAGMKHHAVAEPANTAKAFNLDTRALDAGNRPEPLRGGPAKRGNELAAMEIGVHSVVVNLLFNFDEYSSGIKVKET